ncbi:hypothetical protein Tco_0123836 [Tanacetum coccineum]
MRCMKWPPNSALMIISPSVPSSSSRGENEIYGKFARNGTLFSHRSGSREICRKIVEHTLSDPVSVELNKSGHHVGRAPLARDESRFAAAGDDGSVVGWGVTEGTRGRVRRAGSVGPGGPGGSVQLQREVFLGSSGGCVRAVEELFLLSGNSGKSIKYLCDCWDFVVQAFDQFRVIVAVYGFCRKIVEPYPSGSSECGIEHVAPCWHRPTFQICCRLKDLEVIFRVLTSVICFDVTWYTGPLWEIKIADAGSEWISFLTYPWLG